jgi:hypothetical protein
MSHRTRLFAPIKLTHHLAGSAASRGAALTRTRLAGSDYCRQETDTALEREAAGQTRVVPVIVRPCGWQHLPVQANQALPKDDKPVANAGHEQGHRDAARVQVEDGIRRVLKAIRSHRA